MTRFALIALFGCSLAAVPLPAQLSSSAARVLGQPDLRQNGFNTVDGSELNAPNAVAFDRRGPETHLYVVDSGNHRVLGWRDAASFANGERADLVLGQPTLQHAIPLGIRTGSRGLLAPLGAAVDPNTGDVYVADTGDHRILVFLDPFSNPDRVEPDRVIGQPSFSETRPNSGGEPTQRSLRTPSSLRFDANGGLWVVDRGNHRVLRFPVDQLSSEIPEADLVLGQLDFNAAARHADLEERPNAFGFDAPYAVALHPDGDLYVADRLNARILVFEPPFTSGMAAARVIGQPDLTTVEVPAIPNAASIRGPSALWISSDGALYVGVNTDYRVMVYQNVAAKSGVVDSDRIIGQVLASQALPNVGTFPRAGAEGLGIGLVGIGGAASSGDVVQDPDGRLYIADSGNHRVLSYAPGASSASRVLGQPDFERNGANRIGADSLGLVYSVVIDYSQEPFPLYVADTNNNRVLAWRSSLRFQDGAEADLVIGQPDFNTSIANSFTGRGQSPAANSLASPRGLAVNAFGDLYVADAANNRVLRFPRPFDQEGAVTADLVLGQQDFFSDISAAVTPRSLSGPSDVALGPNGEIYVSDTLNNRVLEYPADPGNGATAVRVFGQAEFTSNTAPDTVTAQSLTSPDGLHVDAFGLLYVADRGANRVVVYPVSPDAPDAAASASTVIGQPSFESSGARNASPTSLNGPRRVSTDSEGRIYVADSGNNRIVVFPDALRLPIADGAAEEVIGQPNLTTSAPNFNSPDGLATPVAIGSPFAAFVDRNDTLYVGDALNNRILHFLGPAVTVSAATFIGGAAVSPGSLVSMFGAGLSEETDAATAVPLPFELVNRVVEVAGDLRAAQLFASPGQFNFQLPNDSPTGLASLVVRRADTDEVLAGGAIAIDTSSPGLFTFTQDGRGRALALNQDGTLNSPANPAPRGSVISLFGTGQGPTNPAVPDGRPAPSGPLADTVAVPSSSLADCGRTAPTVCALVTARPAEILFSGLAPGFVGLWQINVRIPEGDDVLTGDALPVRMFINRRSSNTVSISIR